MEVEAKPKAKPPRAAKPPESRPTAADTEENWRKKGDDARRVKFVVPEDDDEEEEPVMRVPKTRSTRRIVLDDDSEEEGIQPIPFQPLEGKVNEGDRSWVKPPVPKPPFKEKAYKLVPKLDDPNIVQNLVDQTKHKILEGITVEMMVAMNSDYAKKLREITFKTRVPIHKNFMFGTLDTGSEFPFMEDDFPIHLGADAISLDSLPRVDSFFISSEADEGLEPGWIVCTDVVLQYYATLTPGQAPKQIYAAMESFALRVIFPLIMGRESVECVLDTGSQIVSMALAVAERLGLSWDPDVQIYMQSANRQLKKSVGLARNVPFLFGDIPVYLQVHIIEKPAYQVLLGRPFDVITESITQNFKDGKQSLTIRDPNTDRRITMPTHARGTYSVVKDPLRNPKATIEEVEDEGDKPASEAEQEPSTKKPEPEADFQLSSRN